MKNGGAAHAPFIQLLMRNRSDFFASYMKNGSAPDCTYGSRKPQLIHYPSVLSLYASIPAHNVKEHLSISACPKRTRSPHAAPRQHSLFQCPKEHVLLQEYLPLLYRHIILLKMQKTFFYEAIKVVIGGIFNEMIKVLKGKLIHGCSSAPRFSDNTKSSHLGADLELP